uniref:PDZ domain-containing protein n=1 Tax=Glossina brevipalpis TaxID=37001 RepID=A0A1A9WYC7_9MUSC
MSLSKCFPCLQFKKEDVVIKLDYSNTTLLESFPHVCQHERTLEELNLSSTRINNLPIQLFYCQNLRVLCLNNNSLETIPEAIGSLRQLQHLSLSRNFISVLPDHLRSCKHLTHLDLSCNSLQRLPDAITSLISLQELLLNETYLEFLPANFGRLINLRIVELRLNNLISLPKSMTRLVNLQRIDLGGNEFTDLPEVVGELEQLHELWIDFNQIRYIPSNTSKLRELTHLEANGNLMDFFPNDISNWVKVEVLSINANNLVAFPFSIGMLVSLVTFKCESNKLKELPDSILNLENLEELVISYNELKRLPSTIGMLKKLRYLFADSNDLCILPDEICKCANLNVLSISRNKITGLPQNIGHLTQLKVLNIVQNHIKTLPVSVLSLVSLTSLWMSDNQSKPLVPLQYTDVNTKKQLTCFMLPQHGPKSYQNIVTKTKENNSEGECIVGQQREQLLKSANSFRSQMRRICFAEQTVILSASDKRTICKPSGNMRHVNIARKETSSSTPLSTLRTTHVRGNVKLDGAPRDVLMRSPTPYPKELRLMAKYVRNGQWVSSFSTKRSGSLSEAKFNNNNSHHSSTTVDNSYANSKQANNKKFTGTTQETTEFFGDDNPAVFNTNYDVNLCEKHHNVPVLQTNNSNSWHEKNFNQNSTTQHAFGNKITSVVSDNCNEDMYMVPIVKKDEVLSGLTSTDYYERHLLHTDNAQYAYPIPNMQNQLLKPPPYDIARSFTKKSPEDLTKYEAIRKQRQKVQNDNFVTSCHQHEHQQLVQMEQVEHDIMPCLYPEAKTPQVIEKLTVNKLFENEHNSDQQQWQLGNCHNQQKHLATETLTNRDSSRKVLNDAPSTNSYISKLKSTNINTATHSEGSSRNSISKRKPKMPWLFGVHQNPTVEQVTIKREKQVGFEIANLPGKEGLYVVSTQPDTNASRLLCVYDKLLEVDGCDFTNISLGNARQIIEKSGPMLNIMLSRT